jgi:hypothetical protein
VRHDRDGFVRCRVCGCTEIDACNPPCLWVRPPQGPIEDLCTTCQRAAEALVYWMDEARRAPMAALLREVKRQQERPRITIELSRPTRGGRTRASAPKASGKAKGASR